MPAAADASQHSQPSSAKWIPDKDEQADLDAIDAAITRMKKVTPSDPYRLTIPHDDTTERYRHSYRVHADQWLYHTPFDRHEHESLQYLTYDFHEPGKDIFVLQNSQPVDVHAVNGNGVKGRPATGANTPNGGPKKKISLDAYKKQKTGGTVTPETDATKGSDAPAKQPAVKGPIERVKAENDEMLAAVAEEVPAVNESPVVQKDLKRKREDDVKEHKAETGKAAVEPPTKKARASPERPTKPQSENTQKAQEQTSQTKVKTEGGKKSDEEGLPPRLSPGMPPKLSPPLPAKLSPLHKTQDSKSPNRTEAGSTPSLPSRLSPTLPDNIAKALSSRAHLSASQTSELSAPNSASKGDRLTPIKKADGVTKHKSPAPKNGFRANSSSPAVRSDAEDRIRPKTTAARAKAEEQPQEDEIAVGRAANASKPQEPPARPSLLVKIKYKKGRREDIKRILQMRPRPDKSMSQQPESRPVEEAKPAAKPVERRNGERKDAAPVKGVAQKIGPVKKEKKLPPQPEEKPKEKEKPAEKQPEKQFEKHSDKQPEKHVEKRPLPDDERSSSPVKRKKVESSESRKEPSTPAQREVDSPLAQKSGLKDTPGTRKDLLSQAMRREQSQDSNGTHNTPSAISSTPSNTGAQPNGVSKPPSSQPSNKTPKQQAWETEHRRLSDLGRELKHAASAYLNASNTTSDQKLAAVKSIESFLCYLLAFTCSDEAQLASDPKQLPQYKTWRSLLGFYGFVKRTTDPFPPLCGLACSLGVVFNARILEIVTQHPDGGLSTQELLQMNNNLQKAAGDAESRLDVDTLQEAFPRSWARRTKNLAINERLEPSKLAGQFKLPINLATSPVRAARAGREMLAEWVEKERIDYTLKLKL